LNSLIAQPDAAAIPPWPHHAATSGAPQIVNPENNMPFDELDSALMFYDGVRYDEPSIIFTVTPHDAVLQKLKNSQVVFLEKGNERAGLTHLLLRHYTDFLQKGIDSIGIVNLLKHTITNLRPLNIVVEARGLGLEYAFDDTLYPKLLHDTLKVAIGFNGFIVTAAPIGLATVLPKLRAAVNVS
jgi:hypothetical protein